MADTEAGLLPGERLLWTGRPARARVIPGDLIFPGLLLALLLAALALSPRGPADGLGLGDEVVTGAAALACVIATAVRALRVKPDELRRTVYQVTDRRVLITTGTRHAWAAYLDQAAEPIVVPQRDGTAHLMLRAKEKFSLSTLADGQPLPRAFTPGIQPPFPVLRGLPDAELARQVISTGRQRMLQGALDVPPWPHSPAALSTPASCPRLENGFSGWEVRRPRRGGSAPPTSRFPRTSPSSWSRSASCSRGPGVPAHPWFRSPSSPSSPPSPSATRPSAAYCAATPASGDFRHWSRLHQVPDPAALTS